MKLFTWPLGQTDTLFLSYIQKPLLLNRRKFDVRSYLLIACTSPHMVFFRHGYVRQTCNAYDPDSNNLCTHLTNQVQHASQRARLKEYLSLKNILKHLP